MKENCLIVSACGGVKKIYVDLSDYQNICSAIDSEGINIISTAGMQALTRNVQSPLPIVGYCDRNGYYSDKDENSKIARISGYEVIIGDVLLCSVDNKYHDLPIDEETLERLYQYLK